MISFHLPITPPKPDPRRFSAATFPNMKTIIGIDPGNKESGWCIVGSDGKIESSGVMENNLMLKSLEDQSECEFPRVVAIEWIQAMGMAVGKEVFETCLWAGRFAQAAQCHVRLVPRGRIKHHHCGSAKAKDGNIAQALRDKYGQKGTKAEPGYFYGVSSHAWQAFAVAAYVLEGAEHEAEIQINQP
jgi:hypothetical protein